MEEIIDKLKDAGINPVGSYRKLPEIISDAIDTVRAFGFETWVNDSSSGKIVKKIVKELA